MKTLDEVIIGIKEQMGLGDPILIDALHYLKEYQDMIKKLENYQKENQRLKKRVEKLESDAAWDADYRHGQVQGMW